MLALKTRLDTKVNVSAVTEGMKTQIIAKFKSKIEEFYKRFPSVLAFVQSE